MICSGDKFLLLAGSAGSTAVIHQIIGALPNPCRYKVVIVSHCVKNGEYLIAEGLAQRSHLPVTTIRDKTVPRSGHIYIAPGDYHVMMEADGSLSLTVDEKVHYCRPSIDVFFCSAADALAERCIGVLLSGANADGAAGLLAIKQGGGMTLVQSPQSAGADAMPLAAIALGAADFIDSPGGLIARLVN